MQVRKAEVVLNKRSDSACYFIFYFHSQGIDAGI